MSNRVIISHAAADRALALELQQQLESKGIPVLPVSRVTVDDTQPDPSGHYAISESWALVFIATHSSLVSARCEHEWRQALRSKRPVIPVMLEAVELPEPLTHRQAFLVDTSSSTSIEQLARHLIWVQTPPGEVQMLRDRLVELVHESSKGGDDRPEALRAEIQDLESQIAYRQRTLSQPDLARNENRKLLEESLAQERQRLERGHGVSSAKGKLRVVGSAPQGVGETFQNRIQEITTITTYLVAEHSDIRAVSIYGKGGVGKSAIACKVMTQLEQDEFDVDGLVYLSTQSGLGINLEHIYLSIARLTGGETEQTLIATWTNPKTSIAARIQTLFDQSKESRYVVLLDNLEDLLDKEGKLVDNDLRLFVESFLRQEHRARLLITSREPLKLPNHLLRYERRFPLEQGLAAEYAVSLLHLYDRDGRLGLRDADASLLESVAEKTYGFPRALEAVVGILDSDPTMTIAHLMADTALFEGEVTERLVREAQSRLDSNERRLMEAVAVYGRPVTEAAIRFLVEPYLQGVDIGATLRRLARGRYITVNRGSGEYILHPLDRAFNYQQIPH